MHKPKRKTSIRDRSRPEPQNTQPSLYKIFTLDRLFPKRRHNFNYTFIYKSIFLILPVILSVDLVLANFGTEMIQFSERTPIFTTSQLCPTNSQFPAMRKIDGGVLMSDKETGMNCSITFKTRKHNQHFIMRFEKLNLACNDHLILSDHDYNYNSARITDLSCQDSLAKAIPLKTNGTTLTVHYSSDDHARSGNGFRMVLTAVFEAHYPHTDCPIDSAFCRNTLCISKFLFCDGIDHCTDNSDEMHCPSSGSIFSELTLEKAVPIIIVLVLIVIVFVVTIFITIYCRKEDDHYSTYQHHLQRLGIPLHPSSSVMFNHYQYLSPANVSPYLSLPRGGLPHCYSTLPLNMSRQFMMNKNQMPQSPMNGPFVMMPTGISSQPLNMMIPNRDTHLSKNSNRQQVQAYNLVLMDPNTSSATNLNLEACENQAM